jgi:hypothetical protein
LVIAGHRGIVVAITISAADQGTYRYGNYEIFKIFREMCRMVISMYVQCNALPKLRVYTIISVCDSLIPVQ